MERIKIKRQNKELQTKQEAYLNTWTVDATMYTGNRKCILLCVIHYAYYPLVFFQIALIATHSSALMLLVVCVVVHCFYVVQKKRPGVKL